MVLRGRGRATWRLARAERPSPGPGRTRSCCDLSAEEGWTRSWAAIKPHGRWLRTWSSAGAGRETRAGGESERREQDRDQVSFAGQEPVRLHLRALRRVLTLAEGRRPVHRRSP